MLGKIRGFGEKYGWGAVVSSVPYINGILLITAAVCFYLLFVIFGMFGVYPGTPEETMNPLAWILYLILQILFSWLMWSYFVTNIFILLGAAWSLADLIGAAFRKSEPLYQGAVAGLCMTVVPIIMWFRYPVTESAIFRFVASYFIHTHFHGIR
jgi:hypothetical protein